MSKKTPMMKCGHSANAVDSNNNPICAICFGISEGATVISTETISLSGRKARCIYYGTLCDGETDSRLTLAFFFHRKGEEYDEYYCGCQGWD